VNERVSLSFRGQAKSVEDAFRLVMDAIEKRGIKDIRHLEFDWEIKDLSLAVEPRDPNLCEVFVTGYFS
jgi:hypothetical protein